MPDKYRIVYYVNQFFGQIGGEDMASVPVEVRDGAVGPAAGFEPLSGGEVVRTVICGDNYFNENTEAATAAILEAVREAGADIFVAGPAFNAGRYGMACAGAAAAVTKELGIPAVTGMYIENPGVDACRETVWVVSTSDSAADMRKALPLMAELSKKLVAGAELGSPVEEGYIPQGVRKTLFSDKRGSERAVEMLLKRLADEPFETEMPMPVFDTVAPAPAIPDLREAVIALCTSGGIVPRGNPDHVESASAQKWARYDVSEIKSFYGYDVHDQATQSQFYSTHGGYDTSYANEMPDRIAPLDILNEFRDEGYIGGVFPFFYTTTGTGTSVKNAERFGREIGKQLKESGVSGVILTST